MLELAQDSPTGAVAAVHDWVSRSNDCALALSAGVLNIDGLPDLGLSCTSPVSLYTVYHFKTYAGFLFTDLAAASIFPLKCLAALTAACLFCKRKGDVTMFAHQRVQL
jgi:hypothetical protein